MDELTGYELSRDFFNWSFENPEKITPTHVALYFFIIEHNNRMGWKEKFGLPTTMAKEAIGIRNYKTYANTLNDLIEWKFIIMIERSKNQYSANIVALVKNTNANTKALTKASLKHIPKHIPKQVQSIVSINKHNNLITNKPNNIEPEKWQNKNILLSAVDKNLIPESEKQFYEIAISFQSMLIEKFKNQKLSCGNIENAKYVNWINDIRLMIEIDKRTVDDIRDVWNFLKKETIGEDKFAWFLNIQSMSKLRTQYEKVLNKAKISNDGTFTKKQRTANSGIQDEIERATKQMLGIKE